MKIVEFFAKVKLELTLFLFGLLTFGLVVLSCMLIVKNKKISELQNQVVVKTAKLELDKLLAKHNVTKADVQKMRDQSEIVKKEIERLEAQLTKKLSPNMTAEEIAAKFREIGL